MVLYLAWIKENGKVSSVELISFSIRKIWMQHVKNQLFSMS